MLLQLLLDHYFIEYARLVTFFGKRRDSRTDRNTVIPHCSLLLPPSGSVINRYVQTSPKTAHSVSKCPAVSLNIMQEVA
jgi:hypothetical protein